MKQQKFIVFNLINILLILAFITVSIFVDFRGGLLVLGAYSLILGISKAVFNEKIPFSVRSRISDSIVLILAGVAILALLISFIYLA